jgi:hypothetical protein
LIFKGKLSEVKAKLKSGKRVPNTVDLDEAIERLEVGPRVTFTEPELETIRRIQDFRNRFEHYKFSGNKYQVWAELIKFLELLYRFSKEELSIDLIFGPEKLKEVEYILGEVHDEFVQFASKVEVIVFQTLINNIGEELSAEILGINKSLIIPPITQGMHRYPINESRYYTPDFESVDAETNKLLIEVKGGIRFGLQKSIENMKGLLKLNSGLTIWLIIMDYEMSEKEKKHLVSLGLIVSDYKDWNRIRATLSNNIPQ